MAELKPCPFCGCTDIRRLTTRSYTAVWCEGCGAELKRGSIGRRFASLVEVEHLFAKEVTNAWNRRAEDGEE